MTEQNEQQHDEHQHDQQHRRPYRVLVGVDGSEDGLRAARFAVWEAELHGGVLQVAHAVDDAGLGGAWGMMWDANVLEDAGKKIVRDAVELCLADGFPRERIEPQLLRGDAAGVLTRLSREADLVVLGRRSRSGLERMFVGSTSAGMAASAQCPVVMVSQASTPQETGGLKRIGVAVDLSKGSDLALRWTLEEARVRGAELHVVHIVPDLPPGLVPQRPLEPPTPQLLQTTALRALETFVAPFRESHGDVPLTTEVVLGSPLDAIVDRSDALDLIAVGAHGINFPGMNLSGVVRGVMGHARCPVAVIRTWDTDRYGIH